tara:strand:+ start:79 stop:246 length:168 start_codon:yes stop_codon:yes gene_type:complete
MTYSYAWATERKNILHRTDANGKIDFVPVSNENKEYQEYLKWVEEGNTPKDAVFN